MKLEDVEKARRVYLKKIKGHLWLAVGAAILFALIIFFSNEANSSPQMFLPGLLFSIFFIGITTFIIAAFTTRKEANAYRSTYKAYFVEKNLKSTFTDLKYNHNAGLAREVLQSTEMINTGDIYNSNDLTTGKYKDVAFAQADVHIQTESTDSDGDATYTTIFKGRFMIFEFPKKFSFRLEVVEKWFGAYRVPGKNKQTGRKFEKIKVESTEFNKIFKTFAEDGFEAFYILDPALIHNILVLDQQYKGKLFLGFLDNKLIIGLKDGKDAFEPPSIFKKIDEISETEKIAKDIRLITNFIDQLKLDRKLFKND